MRNHSVQELGVFVLALTILAVCDCRSPMQSHSKRYRLAIASEPIINSVSVEDRNLGGEGGIDVGGHYADCTCWVAQVCI